MLKGAHFVAAVAFTFASTNLVIELGVPIQIFLSWKFLAAEIVGGLLLIVTSSVIIRLTYPGTWMEAARDRVNEDSADDDDDFDRKERIRSRAGWELVGHDSVKDSKLVWEEIVIASRSPGSSRCSRGPSSGLASS